MTVIFYSNSLLNETTDTDEFDVDDEYSGSIAWFTINFLLITLTICGNLLTISAILCTKKLNSIIANHFVFSLAISDLFVGLTIPYHMAFYIIEHFGAGKINCLLRFVLISFACSSSITNLLAIATDRYVAIVYPLHYTRTMTRKTSICMILFGWTLSFTIAVIPLVWNNWKMGINCRIFDVIPNAYINFVDCPMFALIWIMMLLLYSRICQEAAGHAKRMKNANSTQSILSLKDSKSFQVMVTILGCFTICWLPYFIIAICSRYYKEMKSSFYYEIVFSLAVANSGMNPIIYAWKNHNFRASFLQLMHCRSPNSYPSVHYVTNHIPSKKNSLYNNGAIFVNNVTEEKCSSSLFYGEKTDLGVAVINRGEV